MEPEHHHADSCLPGVDPRQLMVQGQGKIHAQLQHPDRGDSVSPPLDPTQIDAHSHWESLCLFTLPIQLLISFGNTDMNNFQSSTQISS